MQQDNSEIKGFHAHVYYDESSRSAAEGIREALSDQFDVELGRWREEPVGPHPQAMYQVAFNPDQFDKVVPWLMLNHSGLSVLIHPRAGEDVADHTGRALWLGEMLELNIEFLRNFEKDKS